MVKKWLKSLIKCSFLSLDACKMPISRYHGCGYVVLMSVVSYALDYIVAFSINFASLCLYDLGVFSVHFRLLGSRFEKDIEMLHSRFRSFFPARYQSTGFC